MTEELIEVKQVALNARDKNFSYAFTKCKKLTKVTAYNLAPVDCSAMFRDCWSLTEIVGMETWDMSNCTKLFTMFKGCSSLTDLSSTANWDVRNATNINDIITSVPATNVDVLLTKPFPKVTSINGAYMYNDGITEVDLTNFTNCNVWENVVQNCINVTRVTLPGKGVIDYAMHDNTSLTTINFINETNQELELGDYIFSKTQNTITNVTFTNVTITKVGGSNNNAGFTNSSLTVESLLSLLNALKDYASEGDANTHTCTIGSTNLAKLTNEQKAIATNKGWTLA